MSKSCQFLLNQIIPVLVILFLIVPTLLPLTKPGFFPTQDFIHVARLYEMDQALKDGQFPVRWVADFRYGEPLFNFYAPLPFYIGVLIHNLGLSFLVTTKILLGLGFIFSTLAMFFLGRELFGKLGGILAATLYLYAPYHSVDVYVRGAMSESWALIFFPLIFLGVYKLSQKISISNFLLLSLSLAGLFYTHNVMTVLFTPFGIAWMVFMVWQKKNWQLAKLFGLALILAIGLAASFLLPAYFEKNFVQTVKLTGGYFDFRGHFVELKQFIVPSWGYGASVWGAEDGMSFQIGIIHLILFLISLVLAIVLRPDRKKLFLILFLVITFLFSLFMQHNKSTPIWLALSILEFVQFPWRFLGISIFFISLIGGALALWLNKKQMIIGVILLGAILLANVGYFRPESYYFDSIDNHYIGPQVLNTDDKLPKDYLPIWVKVILGEKENLPLAKSGKIVVSDFRKNSTSFSFQVEVLDNADIEIPVTFFPGWKVWVDGKQIKLEEPTDLGMIRIKLNQGRFNVKGTFGNTPIRTVANSLSVLSLIVIFGLVLYTKLRFGWRK